MKRRFSRGRDGQATEESRVHARASRPEPADWDMSPPRGRGVQRLFFLDARWPGARVCPASRPDGGEMPAVPATIHNELTRLLLILLLVPSTSEGQAADRFVSTAGSDAANCLSSVSPCLTVANGLAQAASGDSVKVAGGNYRENVTISTATTLTLAGGWTADFSAQDPAAMSTVLQAAMQLPVVTSLASGITIDFTADGLTIQGGKNIPETPGPLCQDGLGGGICAQVSSLGSLGVALSRVTLTRNLANSSGGGLA